MQCNHRREGKGIEDEAEQGSIPSGQGGIMSINRSSYVVCLVLCFCLFLAEYSRADGEWEWHNPLPTGNTLSCLWGYSPDDIWISANCGTVVHYDGTSLTSEWLSATGSHIANIWGASATNICATAAPYLVEIIEILHYDGNSWDLETTIDDAGIMSLCGFAEDDIWTAGEDFYHYNGSIWSKVPSPTENLIFEIWGPSSDNIYAVAISFIPFYGEILRYDGNEWTKILETPEGLWELHGTSASDIWFVGYSGYIYHWNGDEFVQMTSPVSSNLFSVYCIAPDDVWIGGEYGDLLHWNGTSFEQYCNPAGTQVDRLWAFASDDVWAISNAGNIIHWNGVIWQDISHNGFADCRSVELRDIWTVDSSDIWVAGGIGMVPGTGVIGHYDGSSWTTVPIPDCSQLDGIWGSSSSDIWAVGWGGGDLLHYDGTEWTGVEHVASDDLSAIWGSSYDDIWAVGFSGLVIHYDGTLWSFFTRFDYSQNAVFGFASDDVWTCGGGGRAHHYDGESWTQLITPASGELMGISGSSSEDIWMCGSGGTVIHYDGSAWQYLPVPTSAKLHGILKETDTSVWVVGYECGSFAPSEMWHYDGNTWIKQLPKAEGSFHNITQSDPEHAWVIGSDGIVLHRYSPGTGFSESYRPGDSYLSVCPNPFGDTVNIGISIAGGHGASGIELRIYDVSGRFIRTLADGDLGSGAHTVAWDGQDENGNDVSTGVYFVQLLTPEQEYFEKLMLLR